MEDWLEARPSPPEHGVRSGSQACSPFTPSRPRPLDNRGGAEGRGLPKGRPGQRCGFWPGEGPHTHGPRMVCLGWAPGSHSLGEGHILSGQPAPWWAHSVEVPCSAGQGERFPDLQGPGHWLSGGHTHAPSPWREGAARCPGSGWARGGGWVLGSWTTQGPLASDGSDGVPA